MKTKTKYTEEEAYELALNLLLNLASKICSGEVTINDLEAIIAPPEQ